MNLQWVVCDDGHWCPLLRLNLNSVGEPSEGVYIIWWASGEDSDVVRVGQGVFRERFPDHRRDQKILEYQTFGPLYVTWAYVEKRYRDGVERFLYDWLKPEVGERAPDADPIQVSLPWR